MDFLKKEMQALILAGGLGTRLRPVTETIPKPMVLINGKPFLEYPLENLRKYGIKDIILCAGYLGNKIEDYFGDGKDFGLNIKYSYEKELLGTAGAIKNAESLIESDLFLVMNGDTYSPINLEKLFFSHNNYPTTMVVAPASNPREQELVEIENNFIINFYERDTFEHKKYLRKNPSPLVNAGTYILNRSLLNLIPPKKKVSLEREIFPKLIGKIHAFEYRGYMKDIANINFCEELEKDITEGRI